MMHKYQSYFLYWVTTCWNFICFSQVDLIICKQNIVHPQLKHSIMQVLKLINNLFNQKSEDLSNNQCQATIVLNLYYFLLVLHLISFWYVYFLTGSTQIFDTVCFHCGDMNVPKCDWVRRLQEDFAIVLPIWQDVCMQKNKFPHGLPRSAETD